MIEAGCRPPARARPRSRHGAPPAHPGGSGLPPVWVTAGFGLALVAVLLPTRRTWITAVGWCVAVVGFIAAVALSRINVTPEGGGQPVAGWPGVALALAALGLLLAVAPAAGWLAEIASNGRVITPDPDTAVPRPTVATAAGYGPFRRALAIVALVAAASAPVLAGLYWLKDGVQGPVGSVSAPLLPAFVSASSTSGQQYRTLILRPNGSVLDYAVVRQSDPTLGEPELTSDSAAEQALSRQVAALGAPDGADAGDPGLVLGSFGIRFVLLPSPVDPALAERLDAALGLDALTSSSSYDLWQVSGPVARVRVIAADGTVTPLSASSVSMSGSAAPAAGGTLVLAEPYGGWTATLNGRALHPVATPVDGWAQGFVLPAGGGKLSLSRNDLAREASLLAELIVALAVCMLALPGKRADPVEQAEAMAALRAARDARRAGRGSRRFARSGADTDVAGAGVADDELAPAAMVAGETVGRRGRMRRPGVAIAGLGASRLTSTRLAVTRRRGGRQAADGGRTTSGRTTSARTSYRRPFPRRSGPSGRPRAVPALPVWPRTTSTAIFMTAIFRATARLASVRPASVSSRCHGTWWATGAAPGGATAPTRGAAAFSATPRSRSTHEMRQTSGIDQTSGMPPSSGAGRPRGPIGGPRPGLRPCRRGRQAGRLPGRLRPGRGKSPPGKSPPGKPRPGKPRRGGPGRSRCRQGRARCGRPVGRPARRRRCPRRVPGPR